MPTTPAPTSPMTRPLSPSEIAIRDGFNDMLLGGRPDSQPLTDLQVRVILMTLTLDAELNERVTAHVRNRLEALNPGLTAGAR